MLILIIIIILFLLSQAFCSW